MLRADYLDHAVEADVLVVTAYGGLGRRREYRLRQTTGLDQPLGQRLSANGATLAVFLPTAAGQVATHDALDRKDLGLLHEHEAAAKRLCVLSKRLRQVVLIGREQMVRHDVGQVVEPEERDPGEHLALVGHGVRQDHIERAQAVGGHYEQSASEVEYVPDLALSARGEVDRLHTTSFRRATGLCEADSRATPLPARPCLHCRRCGALDVGREPTTARRGVPRPCLW